MAITRSKLEEYERKRKEAKEEKKKEILELLKSFPDKMFSLMEIAKETGVELNQVYDMLYRIILELENIEKKIEKKEFRKEEYWGIKGGKPEAKEVQPPVFPSGDYREEDYREDD